MAHSETSSNPVNAFILTGTGWNLAAFGPYGGSWLQTPGINRLAARGVCLDRFILDSEHPLHVLRSLWTGRHALAPMSAGSSSAHSGHGDALSYIAELESETPGSTLLITDDPQAAELGKACGFGEILIEPVASPITPAEDLASTQCARLVSHALSRMDDPTTRLIWLHASYLERCWDSPLDSRGMWGDEDGPPPREESIPPMLSNHPRMDDDVLLSWIHLYADQIAVLDQCIETLLEGIGECEERVIGMLGTSGMALGEHDWLGPGRGPLLSPRNHAPAIFLAPHLSPIRSEVLCQPADWASLLGGWLLGRTWNAPWGRSFLERLLPDGWHREESSAVALCAGNDEWSVHTSHWHWNQHGESERLFLKPDDRFDANNVASRAEEVRVTMRELSQTLRQAIEAGDRDAFRLAVPLDR